MATALVNAGAHVANQPEISCVACGKAVGAKRPFASLPAHASGMQLYRCIHCRLVQQHPRYTPAELKALYAGDYYVFSEREGERWARAVQQYAVHLLPLESGRWQRLLDVGCALGHLSALAAARGWHVCGVDVSAEAVSRASRAFGIDARAGTLASYRTTWPPFDAVFLGDVIEHVPDPAALLREVRSVLAPGGVACIDTPNVGSHWRIAGGSRWLGFNRFHINLFDAAALASLLHDCGFVDVQVGAYTHYRYEGLANRPEVDGWLNRLPAGAAWRLKGLLKKTGRFGRWASLRMLPPDSLDAARRQVERFKRQPEMARRLRGDNLAARARRG